MIRFTRRLYSTASTPRIVNTIAEYRALRNEWLLAGKTIGFVPTMGALHQGHLSLAKTAKQDCDKVVASIFVNPAQFAPTEDLDRYPRTFENDVKLLSTVGVDAVFAPSVQEMYPAGITLDVSKQTGTFVEVKGKSHMLEGSVRPHFFRGVATVVTKLFNVIQPHKAFFGQKDGQQCAVIRTMSRDLLIPTEIVVCQTIRETDGLAMSSRNRYLSVEERETAPVLYRALRAAEVLFEGGERDANVLREVAGKILKESGVPVEYLSGKIGKDGAMMSGAVRIGKTRIIDNVLLGVEVRK
ncbi:Pantoate-beta-alanine ligase [Rhizoclosmatium globosum]|uniref:Pantoate--beta-alanine ligase n=1 Tax=Rhizoclosmatium globosum TaxID=329046 RepID=A0A1Y2CRZ8_9FUNG|nr:Pantoate-beta-alanine ligase [Rhizoclosmatium globosum]|eukprot:ORY49145.1 Pantoate-beta-alanine ligase [Rhizoclosmatium globosum]